MAAQLTDSVTLSGPPYPPRHLGLGGSPVILPDVPVTSVFLILFTLAAIAHMGLFQVNLHKRKRKFAFNATTFGFCFTRTIATTLRIAWAYHPQNFALGLAAQIFVNAGVPILFVNNLFWTQRIVRAQHPRFGWSKPFSIWLPILITTVAATVFLQIAFTVIQFYLADDHTQTQTRRIQLYAATLFALTATLPIPIELTSTLAKTHPYLQALPTDPFGSGSLARKICISTLSAAVLSLGAWYRAITSYLPTTCPTPWYLSKAPFYLFNFTLELSTVILWLAVRVDKMFIIPDGAKGAYSYFLFAPGIEKDDISIPSDSSSSTFTPPTFSRPDAWGVLERGISEGDGPRVRSRSSLGGLGLVSECDRVRRQDVSRGGIRSNEGEEVVVYADTEGIGSKMRSVSENLETG